MSLAGSATFDSTATYRYRLTRVWAPAQPGVTWIMLNPSTASGTRDDPTMRRVVGFSRAWGFGSAVVLNLFALRTPTPRELRANPARLGPDNDTHIEAVASDADFVVVAWGNHGSLVNPRSGSPRNSEVALTLAALDTVPFCLGWTRAGQPRHPLYVPADTTPVRFAVT